MVKILKCAFVVIVSVILALPLSSYAQGADASGSGQPGKGEGRDLGMWWMRNPLKYDPMPEEFLNHVEIQYSYAQNDGNFRRDNHTVNALVVSRKGRFTNYFQYDFDKKHSNKTDDMPGINPDGTIYWDESYRQMRSSESHQLNNTLTFALTNNLFAAGGIEWTKDDFSSIDSRIVYYAGLVYNIYQGPRGLLQVFGGYGYEELEYLQDYYDQGWMAKDLGLIDYFEDGVIKSDKYRVEETLRWGITPSLMFNQSIELIGNLEKKHDRSIFRWTLNVGFDYKIADHVFLNANYMESYDKAPDVGSRKRDKATNIGIKISF